MKKLLGYAFLFISSLLILDQLWALTVFAFEKFGFLVGLLNFSLLPITFFIYPILRLFIGGSSESIVYTVVIVGLFYFSFKLLNEKQKKIERPHNLTLEKNNLPTINAFDLIKALFSVPLSYYSIIFSSGLIAAIALLLIGLIYFIETSFTNMVHTGVLFLIGLGAFIGIVAGLYAILMGLERKRVLTIAFELKDKESPIFLLVKEVSERLKTAMPKHILISFTADLYVHQSKVLLLDGTKFSGKTLTIGYIYLKYLSPQEAKAIIVHELAHFTGRDTLFSLYVFPTYKSFRVLIQSLSSIVFGGSGNSNAVLMAIPNILSLFIISKFYDRFSILIAKIDRIREARADMIGAICYGTNAFRRGLTTVARVQPVFSNVSERDYLSFLTNYQKVFTNYFEFFEKTYLKDRNINKQMDNMIEHDRVTSKLDNHFSLKERLEYLPNNNDMEYKKALILSAEIHKEYENKLSEMYGTFVSIISQKMIASNGRVK